MAILQELCLISYHDAIYLLDIHSNVLLKTFKSVNGNNIKSFSNISLSQGIQARSFHNGKISHNQSHNRGNHGHLQQGHGQQQQQQLQGGGSIVIACLIDNPLIIGWDLNDKPSIIFKSIIPEKLSFITKSHSNIYLVGGGKSGRIYIWHYSSGILLRMWDSHYKEISQIAFTIDDKSIITASLDGQVKSYLLNQILSPNFVAETPPPEPQFMLTGHSLPVTAIHISATIQNPHIYTASHDRTVKHYNPNNSITTIHQFPRPITTLLVDNLETHIYAGDITGTIHRKAIHSKPGNGHGHDGLNLVAYTGHSGCVTGVKLSLDESMMISSGEDMTVIVWSVSAVTALRVFKPPININNPIVRGAGSGLGFKIGLEMLPVGVWGMDRVRKEQNGLGGGVERGVVMSFEECEQRGVFNGVVPYGDQETEDFAMMNFSMDKDMDKDIDIEERIRLRVMEELAVGVAGNTSDNLRLVGSIQTLPEKNALLETTMLENANALIQQLELENFELKAMNAELAQKLL